MAKVTIRENTCKGCGLCVGVCPKQVLAIDRNKINEKGHCPASPVNPEACIGCAFCATICPDCAITVEK